MAKYLAIILVAAAAVLVGVSGARVTRQAEEGEEATAVPSEIETKLGLPSNSTSIRANIVDSFTCEGKTYGYYADVENECQIFHVCQPVTLADGKEQTFKWSFICPEETIFNQESFTCARPEDSVPCEEAPNLYSLNANFGVTDQPQVGANDPEVRQRSADLKVETKNEEKPDEEKL